MLSSTLLLLSTTISFTLADFFISNSSVCMGAFPFSHCYHSVAVLSGVVNNTDFNCHSLMTAEDNNYIVNGTVGPWGSPYLSVPAGICDSGTLNFEMNPSKHYDIVDRKMKKMEGGNGYIVTDKDGKHVGDCRPERNLTSLENDRACNQWVGVVYFETAFRCTSSVCS